MKAQKNLGKSQNAKGTKSLNTKELLLIIGLTVVLSMVISIATLSLTGNAVSVWDDSIGGFPAKEPAQPEPKTVQEQAADLFVNAELLDAYSGGSSTCYKRCKDVKKQCLLALNSIQQQNTKLWPCTKVASMNGQDKYLTCLCGGELNE